MPKVLWRTFNSASVFLTAGSESPPPLPTKRDGPIRFVHCASLNKKKQKKQQNTFVCRALNSKIHVAAQEACRSFFFPMLPQRHLVVTQTKNQAEARHCGVKSPACWHMYRQHKSFVFGSFFFCFTFKVSAVCSQYGKQSLRRPPSGRPVPR